VLAGGAGGGALVALLPPQSACVATFRRAVSRHSSYVCDVVGYLGRVYHAKREGSGKGAGRGKRVEATRTETDGDSGS
jgi:hypothetical protein